MNAVQVFSYRGRNHDNGDDFELIQRGGGNSDLEFRAFSALSYSNVVRLENDVFSLLTKPQTAEPDDDLFFDFKESEDGSDVISASDAAGLPSFSATTDLELQPLYPHDDYIKYRLNGEDSLFTNLPDIYAQVY